ncbi:hypothetical protein DL766_003152 [Monosporascus sp. MC13-8B]|uniref:Uncharacterized protein n=1 Tax=Monosporascus cannonballus TaxID=155416 RepID=A0ABY0H4Z2_9PEZI|nr:hypothetical protein DL762_005425 [Monosporascus cannonballus]RYO98146.1 hypothetical protein DL763_002387 [Monosporascus cannonballus]RYP34059.1 hypothetical protein DL766_003152 [Monosporascus sp. MC13-8B]
MTTFQFSSPLQLYYRCYHHHHHHHCRRRNSNSSNDDDNDDDNNNNNKMPGRYNGRSARLAQAYRPRWARQLSDTRRRVARAQELRDKAASRLLAAAPADHARLERSCRIASGRLDAAYRQFAMLVARNSVGESTRLREEAQANDDDDEDEDEEEEGDDSTCSLFLSCLRLLIAENGGGPFSTIPDLEDLEPRHPESSMP